MEPTDAEAAGKNPEQGDLGFGRPDVHLVSCVLQEAGFVFDHAVLARDRAGQIPRVQDENPHLEALGTGRTGDERPVDRVGPGSQRGQAARSVLDQESGLEGITLRGGAGNLRLDERPVLVAIARFDQLETAGHAHLRVLEGRELRAEAGVDPADAGGVPLADRRIDWG